MTRIACPHCGHPSARAPGTAAELQACPQCRRPLTEAAAPFASVGATDLVESEGNIPWYLQAHAETSAPTADLTVPNGTDRSDTETTDTNTSWVLQAAGAEAANPSAPSAEAAPVSASPPANESDAASDNSTAKNRKTGPVSPVARAAELRAPDGASRAEGSKPRAGAPLQNSSPLPPEPGTGDVAPGAVPRRRSAPRIEDAPESGRSKPESKRPARNDERAEPSLKSRKTVALTSTAAFMIAALAGAAVLVVAYYNSHPQANSGDPPKPPTGPLPPSEFKPQEIAERLIPSTVLISPDKTFSDVHSPIQLGSGVLVHREPYVVLTNWHVVEDAKNKTVLVFFPDRDARNQVVSRIEHYRSKAESLGIPAKILFSDTYRDIAMLELSRAAPDSAVPIVLAQESAKQLEPVFGNGQSGVNFSALWQSNAGKCRQLVDLPLVRGRPTTSRVLITDQAVNPGDSGGPVVNSRLELVGLVRSKASKHVEVSESDATKVLRVEGLDNFSLAIDVEELRSHLNDGFHLAYGRSFPNLTSPFAPGAGRPGDARDTGPRRTPAELVHVFETGTPEQARLARREIQEAGQAVVPLLINMLQSEEQRGNWPKALEALVWIDNPAVCAPAVEVAIRCLKDDMAKTKIETKIAAAKFLRVMNSYGKNEALPVLWACLAVNDPQLRTEVRETIRRYGPYNRASIGNLKRLAGIAGLEDPDKLRAINPFVKAFYIILLRDMEDLTQTEFSQEIEQLKIFTDPDPRMRAFMAEVLIEDPEKLSRRDRFRAYVPLLGDSGERVTRKAREALEDMTWLFDDEKGVTYKQFKEGKIDGGVWSGQVDGKEVRLSRRRLKSASGESLVDDDNKQLFVNFGHGYAPEHLYWAEKVTGFVTSVRYKLTDRVLGTLRSDNVPAVVLTKLSIMKNKEFLTEEELEKQLARDLTASEKAKYSDRILKLVRDDKQETKIKTTISLIKDRKLTEDDIDVLVRILQDPYTPPDGQIYVLDLLLSVGKRAQIQIALIAPLLSEKVPTEGAKKERNLLVIVRVLCLMLAQKKPVDVGAELLKLCEHPQQDIRTLALLCLPLLGNRSLDKEILSALYLALDDDNGEIRKKAKQALNLCLGVREDRFADEIQQSITALTTSAQADKRMAAAHALAHLGPKADVAARALVRALDDKDISVRTNAVVALGKIGPAAKDGAKQIGELLLHEYDEDQARRRLGGEYFADTKVQLDQNLELRNQALKALGNLKEHAQDALPALAKFIGRTTRQEDIVLAVGAIRSITKAPGIKCDKMLTDNLINLFQRDLIRDDVVESMNELLEYSAQKRGPVPSAVIDAFREMGPKALPGLREYLSSKKNRATPRVDALQVMGSVEAIIAIISSEGFVIEREVQTQLAATLHEVRNYHKGWMPRLKAMKVPQTEIEVFDRMLSRISEAYQLLIKAPVKKD